MNQTTTLARQELADAVHTALQRWHNGQDDDPLTRLALNRQLLRQGGVTARQASQRLLVDALEQLAATNHEGALILRLHYLDDRKVYVIANQLALHEGTVNKKQREAIAQLVDLIYAQEQAACERLRTVALARLEPPTYLQLFGVEAHVDHLLAQIMAPGPPWLYAIEGIGGIGKTTLADSLMRRALDRTPWCDIAWVTARQRLLNLGGYIDPLPTPALTADALVDALCGQLLPEAANLPRQTTAEKFQMLRSMLKRTPHLIVIDNLETVQDVDVLLAHLRELADPTCFILTSRHNLYHEHDIHHFAIPDLDHAQALALVRFEAAVRNLPAIAAASDAELTPIYAAVGGNPLALRLVVGQLHVHSLPAILHDLATVNSRKVESLYTFIYRRAWDNLDEPGRRLLLAMPLTDSLGADLDFLAAVSALEEDELRHALDALVMLNLIDARGALQHRRYSIHSLTRTFLQEQVAKWQTSPLL
ncbi:MAG: AAA family ATPase [Caldilinea sp.]|nr:AAA family ATPase [Caldilinea sp.]